MSAFLLAVGVIAHIYSTIILLALVHAAETSHTSVVGAFTLLIMPGLFGVVYFWAKAGGMK